jgi:hypothetical protein
MKRENPGKKSRILKWAGIATFVALILVYVKVRHVMVPQELVGTWHTADARYAGRSFEIGYATVNFGTGEEGVSTGFVEDIQSTPGEHGTLYTISYSQDDTKSQVSFYYDGNGDKTIRFKNQDETTWVKDERPEE